MTAAERRKQVEREQFLDRLPPKLRSSEQVAALADKAFRTDALTKVLQQPIKPAFGGKFAPGLLSAPAAADSHDDYNGEHPLLPPGALWQNDLSSPNDPSDLLAEEGTKQNFTQVPSPSNPTLQANPRPGRTTWTVGANWAPDSAGQAPLFTKLELYQTSNNQLVATRLSSADDYNNRALPGKVTEEGMCMEWLRPLVGKDAPIPPWCVWQLSEPSLHDGMNYYAKLSFATQAELHVYKMWSNPDTYRIYWLPTQWTTPTVTPSAPAIYTPGIPDGMGGSCTCSYQSYMGDPVNTATGAVTESATDVSVPGVGLPFTLSRAYRSTTTTADGLLGKGWSLPFEAKLQLSADKATLVDGDGAQIIFLKASDGSFVAPKPVRFTLASGSDGYTVTALDGSSRAFDSSGRLAGVYDSDKRGVTLTYSGSRLAKATDAAGRSALFTVDSSSGRLSQVDLADGRKVTYGFAGNQLASVKGIDGGVTKYTYDGGGRLATIVDPNGNTIAQNTYDASSGRITQQIDATGKKYTFAWTPEPYAPVGSGQSNMTDPAGGIWSDVYEAGVLTRHYDPLGHGPSKSYDKNLNATNTSDGNNKKTAASYDAHGNVSSATLDGVTEKWGFDGGDRLTSHTDGRGGTTSYQYDGTSTRITSVKSPTGDTRATYTSSGQPEKVTSADGRTVTYAYDAAGHLTSVTSAAGDKTTYTYDAQGQLKTQTDPRGNVSGATAAQYTTTYDYWPSGQVKTVTDPLGHVTAYTYDANGNMKTATDALNRVVAYEYDAFNRVTKVTAPGGRTTLTTYDDRGNVASTTDPAGAKTTYVYDAANRLASQTSPRGNVTGADAAKFTTTYGYDKNGNLTQTVDPTGAVTSTAYDAFNRPTLVTDALGQATKSEYDAAGNLVRSTDPLGKATAYTYTPSNLQETVTNPLGKTTRYGYDGDGHRTSVTSPSGAKSTWSFDVNGRLKSQTDARGNAAGADPAKFTTTYGYDAAGNQATVTNPLGERTTTEYNALNQAVSVTNPLGKVTATDYDGIGRIAKVTAPDGGVTSYSYNPTGEVATRKDANGHTTTYDYDDAGRQAAITDPLGRKQTTGYDKDGNPTTRTNARGVTATTTFDARNLPSGTTYSDNTPSVSEAYDAIGQRRSITDATGSRTLDYDKAGRLTAVTPAKGKGSFGYTYDDAGRLTSTTLDPVTPTALDWSGAAQTASGDLNGDGITDVIRTDAKGGLRTFLGRPDGTFTEGTTLAGSGTGFQQLFVGEYTSDGKPDLLALDKTGRLLRFSGDGKGGFAAPSNLGAGWGSFSLSPGDFNNDGKPDLMAVDTVGNHLFFYPGNGAGGFGDRKDLGNGWGSFRLTLIDVNADNKPDVLAIDPATGHFYLYPGTGAGGFGDRKDLGGGWGAMRLVSGEFNNDSQPDLLALNTSSHRLYVYPGAGNGGFKDPIQQTDDWTPYGDPAPGKFDGDKNVDIAAADTSGKLRIWKGDGQGHLTGAAVATTPAGGSKTSYGYNDDGQRISETTATGTINYSYDPAGNLTTTQLPATNGYTEQRSYDNAGRLAAISSVKGTTTLASWSQVFDGTGQPARIDVTRAGKPASYQYYTYDPAGRLLTDCSSSAKADTCPDVGSATTFSYDPVGNRKTQNKAGTATTYTYDNADQLSQTVTGPSTRAFTYDADGNQTGAGGDTFTYDANNRLTAAASNGASYAYTYDADGNRTTASKDGSGLQRSTAWDINNSLPLAAADYNSSGALSAQYRYNPLGQIQAETTDTGTFYHHRDLIGSVTDLTDANGALQTSYSYTAFGEITQANTAANPPANPFTYTGEYREPSTSAAGYYLRARNYTPDTGRFTSQDPYNPGQGTPYGTAYGYVENAPTSRTDPSGMCSVWADVKDFFNGKVGTKSDCSKEDHKNAQKGGTGAVTKGSADALSKDLIQQFGGAGTGIVDGMSFGAFSYMDPYAACLSQTDGYNYGLYGSMVPFPLSGGPRAATEGGLWAAARVNLPSWKAIAVDMVHVLERHTANGKIYKQSGIKTKFPDSWSPAKIEKAVLNAYRFGRSVKTQGSRIQLQGMTDGLMIEMWFDRATNLIETAYPIWR
uniref:FG-GAP-like repeat-containing protein n=1 Tax=Streptomyces sp. NBC_00003 TaxID=2903608 RepID=A0AAU2V2F5_9ACTN